MVKLVEHRRNEEESEEQVDGPVAVLDRVAPRDLPTADRGSKYQAVVSTRVGRPNGRDVRWATKAYVS